MADPSTVASAPASLYVGDLPPDVTDDKLFDAFSEFKSLASVRVCKDSSTGRSLCYGYVNFISPQDAIRAIEVKNNSLLKGKLIRVMWSRRDPDARKSGIGNVFVKNLPASIDNSGLQELFKVFGHILSCKVAVYDDGKSKGHGFVQFETEESANAAIEKMNGFAVGDKQIYAGRFIKKTDRSPPSSDIKFTNLYMKNLDPEVGEEYLQKAFSSFGKIVSLAVAKDEYGASRGFGFVNFENPDDARQAMNAMNGAQLGSKILYVARAQKKAEREHILRHQFEEKRKEQMIKYKGSNLYVKNIADSVTDEDLEKNFSTCGTITSAKLMRDKNGISKGFGFVSFSSPEEANKAVNTFHGVLFYGKPLYVAVAQRKEERQAQLQLQYAQHLPAIAGPSTAVIPGGYPPYYYTAASVVPPVPTRPGMLLQPLGLRPGWRPNDFASPVIPSFPSLNVTPNKTRQHRQNRGRAHGHVSQDNPAAPYIPNMPYPTRSAAFSKEPTKTTRQRTGHVKYVPNGRQHEMEKGSRISYAASNSVGGSQGSQMLHSKLAAASPEQQKQILGERLYPLVHEHKPNLASKITGMLLEMDNSELLLLLESPESLSAKVYEAVHVLKNSTTKVSAQEPFHTSFLSAEVAVN